MRLEGSFLPRLLHFCIEVDLRVYEIYVLLDLLWDGVVEASNVCLAALIMGEFVEAGL